MSLDLQTIAGYAMLAIGGVWLLAQQSPKLLQAAQAAASKAASIASTTPPADADAPEVSSDEQPSAAAMAWIKAIDEAAGNDPQVFRDAAVAGESVAQTLRRRITSSEHPRMIG